MTEDESMRVQKKATYYLAVMMAIQEEFALLSLRYASIQIFLDSGDFDGLRRRTKTILWKLDDLKGAYAELESMENDPDLKPIIDRMEKKMPDMRPFLEAAEKDLKDGMEKLEAAIAALGAYEEVAPWISVTSPSTS